MSNVMVTPLIAGQLARDVAFKRLRERFNEVKSPSILKRDVLRIIAEVEADQ